MVLKLRDVAPDNWEGAKCLSISVNRDNDSFFSEEEEEIQEALDFCNGKSDNIICPIRNKCLDFALVNNERFGVWGGCDEITRRAIRRKYPARANKRNENWHWMSKKDALKGLRKEELLPEEDEE